MKIAAPITSMLKISESTESTTRLGKGGVGVVGDGSGGGSDNGSRCSGDFDRKFYLLYDSRTTHLNAQDELINEFIN